ncbi:MAG TPA: tetratricopeptide repeat protein [Rhodanobacteraceae bacterium]|nr:tetratricopeptide repeat protein [Rhodanobacteraceae bacterium]
MKRSLFAELRRRNVFKAGAAYLALGWVVVQITATLVPVLNLPSSLVPIVTWIGLIGFPFVVTFSWVYELTPEGLKRESQVDRSASITHITSRRLDYIVIALLVLAIGLFAFDRFVPRRVEPADASREAQTPAAAASGTSIAVLPFVNMSSDKEQDFFSDGISEELLNLLAKIPQLQVTARTSSFAFKGKETGIPEIARTLHVANVLEGSVRKSGNSVRITAQLIRAGTDTHLWSQTYDRKLDDIFAIQDEIAADVVKQLEVTLLGAAPKARTTDPEAYALYLQAVQLGRQTTAEAFQQSDALYRKALTIDPRYAPAWAALAENLYHEASQGMLSNKDAYSQAHEAAMKALAIDPEYAPAHGRLGYLAMFGDNDLAGAAQHFKQALALDPTDLDVLRNSAVLLQSLGRLDEALTLEEAVVRRDPVNLSALFNLGIDQRVAGRLDAAIASFRTVLSLAPGRGSAHCNLGVALLQKGDAQGALAETEQETTDVWKAIGLPMAYHALWRKAESDATLAALIAKYEKDAPYNIAYVYAYRGEADQAFEWLDKAVEYGDGGLGEIVTENLFDKIHTDPRWLAFLRKIGKAPEQLAKIEFKVTLPQVSGGTPSGPTHP